MNTQIQIQGANKEINLHSASFQLAAQDEINIVIANPKWVKAVKGNKDYEKDSK